MSETESLEEAIHRLCTIEAPLNQRLAEFSAILREKEPHYSEAYDQLIHRLAAAKAGGTAPDVGDVLPPFVLPDGAANLHRLDDLLENGPAVISFNRGHWCPYCKIELNALKQGLNRIAKTGAKVVSIMPEFAEYVASMANDVENAFLVLSDVENGYALSLGLAMWVGDRVKSLYRADQIDLEEYQHNGAYFLPIPATFVVAADRRVVARFVDPDFRKRMEIDDIIAALKRAWI